jgi:hypothetical protein
VLEALGLERSGSLFLLGHGAQGVDLFLSRLPRLRELLQGIPPPCEWSNEEASEWLSTALAVKEPQLAAAYKTLLRKGGVTGADIFALANDTHSNCPFSLLMDDLLKIRGAPIPGYGPSLPPSTVGRESIKAALDRYTEDNQGVVARIRQADSEGGQYGRGSMVSHQVHCTIDSRPTQRPAHVPASGVASPQGNRLRPSIGAPLPKGPGHFNMKSVEAFTARFKAQTQRQPGGVMDKGTTSLTVREQSLSSPKRWTMPAGKQKK